MSSWTLRGFTPRFEYRGERQDHPAALRAQRYVRRHAWQFHGAGVEAAVAQLTGLKEFGEASNAMKDVMVRFSKSISVALNVPVGPMLILEPEAREPIVGWRTPHSGLLLCLKHHHRGATPVIFVLEGATCAVCGDELA